MRSVKSLLLLLLRSDDDTYDTISVQTVSISVMEISNYSFTIGDDMEQFCTDLLKQPSTHT